MRRRMMFLLLLLLGALLLPTAHGQDFPCNLVGTTTSTTTTTKAAVCETRPWQLDKICESRRQEGQCSDCLDCDPCRTHSGDCEACSNNLGCYFCPGDAICSSFTITGDIWDRLGEESELGDELQPSCRLLEDWQTTCSSESVVDDSNITLTTAILPSFSDPLMPAMAWVYEMIRVSSVWDKGIFGNGIRIRVNDVGGVDASHAEFDDRFDRAASCPQYLPPELELQQQQQQQQSGSAAVGSVPTLAASSQHGTGVASLALGGANNDQCAVGIAPEAILSACTLPAVGNPLVYATTLSFSLDRMDISVNSWTIDACVQAQNYQRRRRRATEWHPLQDSGKQRQLQLEEQDAACPFSNTVSTSPCNSCTNKEWASTNGGADLSGLSLVCMGAISNYCLTRFEADEHACGSYLALYTECNYDSYLTLEEQGALETGITNGREGLGILFVMSAGNGYFLGDSTNDQKWINTRYTISVGAVDKKGGHASYSATGASLFVSAPGGDFNQISNNWVAQVGGGCHDIGPGTSFSTPVVAGALALLLEVSPGLGWRDVQGILATTSQAVNPNDESWTTNGAGLQHSYKYGFGILDVEAAVAAVESWDLWGPEEALQQESGVINLIIPPHSEESLLSGTVTTMLTIAAADKADFQVESVVVMLQIEHPSRGDLSIVLISPEETESIMHFSPRPENTHLNEGSFWELMTVRNWGESPNGDWTLSIRDDRSGNLQDECVDIPWTFILGASPEVPTGAKVTCGSIKQAGACANGQLLNPDITLLADADTRQPPDATCCVCGGGMKPSKTSQLVSWSLTVYGSGGIVDESAGEEPPDANGSIPSSQGAISTPATLLVVAGPFIIVWLAFCMQ